MMEDDEVIPAGKEYIMEYEPEWGSHIDMSVEFDGGEKTVVEGFCLTTHNWISFDKCPYLLALNDQIAALDHF